MVPVQYIDYLKYHLLVLYIYISIVTQRYTEFLIPTPSFVHKLTTKLYMHAISCTVITYSKLQPKSKVNPTSKGFVFRVNHKQDPGEYVSEETPELPIIMYSITPEDAGKKPGR